MFLRIAVMAAGLLLPPFLALFGVLRGWKEDKLRGQAKAFSPVVLGAAVFANWIVFGFYVATEQIGGLGVDYQLGRYTGEFLALSLLLLIFAIGATSFRFGLLLANFLLLIMWFSIAYAPQHWLERMDFKSVTVDDHPVASTMYIGNPRQSEAEAIALVDVPGVGDYFLDFGEGTFRPASKGEAVTFPVGAWTWRQMTRGKFGPPLPFRRVNEYRIRLSDGRVLTIAF